MQKSSPTPIRGITKGLLDVTAATLQKLLGPSVDPRGQVFRAALA